MNSQLAKNNQMTKILAKKKAKLHEFLSWFFLNACFTSSEDFDEGYAENIWSNGFGGFINIDACHTYIVDHWDTEIEVITRESETDDHGFNISSDFQIELHFDDKVIYLSCLEIYQ